MIVSPPLSLHPLARMWRTVERKLEVTASTVDGAPGAAAEFMPDAGRGEPPPAHAPAPAASSRRTSGGGGRGGSADHGSDIRTWLGGGAAAPAPAADAEPAPDPAVRLHVALAQPPAPPAGHGAKRGREVIDLLEDDD